MNSGDPTSEKATNARDAQHLSQKGEHSESGFNRTRFSPQEHILKPMVPPNTKPVWGGRGNAGVEWTLARSSVGRSVLGSGKFTNEGFTTIS